MSEEPFLKRWSRRKVEAQRRARAGDEPEPARGGRGRARSDDRSSPSEPTPAPEAEPQEKRELTEADFADVDFDALDAKSDYSRFLRPGVPESIKNKALRKLWMSDARLHARPIRSRTTCTTTPTPPSPCRPARSRPPTASARASSRDEEVAEWEKLGKPPEATNDATAGAEPAEGAQAAAAATAMRV